MADERVDYGVFGVFDGGGGRRGVFKVFDVFVERLFVASRRKRRQCVEELAVVVAEAAVFVYFFAQCFDV